MNGRTQYSGDEQDSILGFQNGQPPSDQITPIQGLFFDLLGCLDGSSNSGSGQKAKPMTGFSQILSMITETMEAQNFNGGSAQSPSSSEPRIHEIFQHSSSILMGHGLLRSEPYSPPSTASSVQERQPSAINKNITLLHPAQRAFTESSNSVSSAGPGPTRCYLPLPSRIPRRQDSSCQSIQLPQPPQNAFIQLPVSEKKECFMKGDGCTDVTAVLDSFPQELANAMTHYNHSELPKNIEDIEALLKIAGYTPPSQVLETESHPRTAKKLEDSSSSKSPGAVTMILDKIVGVAYHCCCDHSSGGACLYCSAPCADDASSETTTAVSSQVSVSLDKQDSNYYDCLTGEESGDDGHHWSSGPESEYEARV